MIGVNVIAMYSNGNLYTNIDGVSTQTNMAFNSEKGFLSSVYVKANEFTRDKYYPKYIASKWLKII